MPHVDDGTLHALLDGALRSEDPERAAAIEHHLAGCPDCRARLEAADELRGRAAGILAAATPEATAGADFNDVLARSGRTGGRRHAPAALRRQARWIRNAAWAASLVLALGTGYLLRDLTESPSAIVRDRDPQSEVTGPTQPVAGDAGEARARPPAAGAPAPAPAGADEDAASADDAGSEAIRARGAARAEEGVTAGGRALLDSSTGAADPAAPTASAPRAGEVSSMARTAEDAEVWSVATLSEARRALAGPVYRLPRAEILEIYVSSGEGRRAVMTRQRLESGIPVQVVQRWGEGAAAPDTERNAEKAASDQGALPRPEVARTTRGDYVLEVTGSLPAALLEILAESAIPAP